MNNPRTSQEAVQYVFNSHKSELITYYPAEFKIAWENRYVWKICMNLVSAVCRPAGHKIHISALLGKGHLLLVMFHIPCQRHCRATGILCLDILNSKLTASVKCYKFDMLETFNICSFSKINALNNETANPSSVKLFQKYTVHKLKNVTGG